RVERLVLDVQALESYRTTELLRVEERGKAFAERDGRFAVEQRHELAVPPHVRLAADERIPPPRAPRVEVVAREQGGAAGAEKLTAARVEGRCSARDGAFEMREEGHYLPSSSVSFFF